MAGLLLSDSNHNNTESIVLLLEGLLNYNMGTGFLHLKRLSYATQTPIPPNNGPCKEGLSDRVSRTIYTSIDE